MSDALISYSSAQRDFGQRLYAALKNQPRPDGKYLDIWMDWQEIPPTSSWWAQIRQGIEEADNFVFLMTTESMGSPICQLEVELALSLNKRMVVVDHLPTDEPKLMEVLLQRSQEALAQDILKGRDIVQILHNNRLRLGHIQRFVFTPNHEFDTRVPDLAKAILLDLDHKRQHTDFLQQALKWERREQNPSYLFDGEQLITAKTWLANAREKFKEPIPTPLHETFIQASDDYEKMLQREAQEREDARQKAIREAQQAEERTRLATAEADRQAIRAKNLRRVALFASAFLGVALIVAFGTTLISREATQNAANANAQSTLAIANANSAATREANANVQVQQAVATVTQAGIILLEVQGQREIASEFSQAILDSDTEPQAIIERLSELIATYPDESLAYQSRGLAYYKQQEYVKAIEDFSQAFALNNTDFSALQNRALAYSSMNDVDSAQLAVEDVSRILTQQTTDTEQAFYLNWRACLWMALAENDQAMADVQKALTLDPAVDASIVDLSYTKPITQGRGQTTNQSILSELYSCTTPFTNLGNIYSNLNQYSEAIEAYTKALDINPTDSAAYKGSALARYRQGELELAIADLDIAIELEPNNADSFNSRGVMRNELQDFEGAVADYTEAIRLDATNALFYRNRGNALTDLGYLEEALVDFTESIHLDPTASASFNNRGYTRTLQDDFRGAVEDFSQAIALNPNNSIAYQNRGLIRSQLGDYTSAIIDFNETIAREPTSAIAYYGRGNAYYSLGDIQLAIQDYSKAIHFSPDNAEYYNVRAYTIFEENPDNVDLAIADINDAIRLAPNEPNYYDSRCEFYLRSEQYEKGLQDCDKAQELGYEFSEEMLALIAEAQSALTPTATPKP